jgi:hypothetical protein
MIVGIEYSPLLALVVPNFGASLTAATAAIFLYEEKI